MNQIKMITIIEKLEDGKIGFRFQTEPPMPSDFEQFETLTEDDQMMFHIAASLTEKIMEAANERSTQPKRPQLVL